MRRKLHGDRGWPDKRAGVASSLRAPAKVGAAGELWRNQLNGDVRGTTGLVYGVLSLWPTLTEDIAEFCDSLIE